MAHQVCYFGPPEIQKVFGIIFVNLLFGTHLEACSNLIRDCFMKKTNGTVYK